MRRKRRPPPDIRRIDRIGSLLASLGSLGLAYLGWFAPTPSSLTVALLMTFGLFAVAFTGCGLIFWSAWKTRQLGDQPYCEHCGYSLVKNESGVCPECGQVAELMDETAVEDAVC